MKKKNIYEIAKGDHILFLYDNEKDHKTVILDFVKDGIEKNERIIYIHDTHTREEILDIFNNSDLDLEKHLKSEQIIILETKKTYLVNGAFNVSRMLGVLSNETEKSLFSNFTGLRITGETIWLKDNLREFNNFAHYENEVNFFFKEHPTVALCQYKKDVFDPEFMIKILESHPFILFNTEIYENFYFIPPQITKEKNSSKKLDLYIKNMKKFIDNKNEADTAKKLNKINENRLKFALEGAGDAIWDWFILTNEVYYSDSWLTMLGYSNGDFKHTLKTWETLMHPDDLELAKKEINSVFKKEKTIYTSEFRLKCKNGSWKWILSRGKIIEWDEDENPIRFAGTHTDITKRKNNEKELEIARELSEKANKAKTEFLSNMSHEIRNPLNGIVACIEILKFSDLSFDQKDTISLLERSSENLTEIVNDVLDLSKIEAGKLGIFKETVNLKKILENNYDLFLKNITKTGKNITFIKKIDKNLPEFLLADKTKLNQIIINLLSNALKFTNSGEIEISCEEVERIGNKSVIRLIVSDTGIGITEDVLDKLFDRFYQVDSSINKHYQGTGLGLAIVKSLVDLMYGHIEVFSEYQVGTEFSIELTLELASLKYSINKKLSLDIKDNFNVLLAEDNLVSQKVFKKYFDKINLSCSIANDGQEAVEMCLENNYDLIFMDINMPRLNGIKASKEIRKFNKDIKIIALTAYALNEEIEEILNNGIDDFLIKPLKLEDLVKKIKEHT